MRSLCEGRGVPARRRGMESDSATTLHKHLVERGQTHTTPFAYRAARRVTQLAAVIGTALLATAWPAYAGVGLAVVLDLPSEAKVGESNLDGSVTIVNVNTERDADS